MDEREALRRLLERAESPKWTAHELLLRAPFAYGDHKRFEEVEGYLANASSLTLHWVARLGDDEVAQLMRLARRRTPLPPVERDSKDFSWFDPPPATFHLLMDQLGLSMGEEQRRAWRAMCVTMRNSEWPRSYRGDAYIDGQALVGWGLPGPVVFAWVLGETHTQLYLPCRGDLSLLRGGSGIDREDDLYGYDGRYAHCLDPMTRERAVAWLDVAVDEVDQAVHDQLAAEVELKGYADNVTCPYCRLDYSARMAAPHTMADMLVARAAHARHCASRPRSAGEARRP